MTRDQKIIKTKLGLLKLAQQLGNVSEACNVMGYSRDRLFRHQKRKIQRIRYAYCRGTFRRWKKEYGLINPESYGLSETVKA